MLLLVFDNTTTDKKQVEEPKGNLDGELNLYCHNFIVILQCTTKLNISGASDPYKFNTMVAV